MKEIIISKNIKTCSKCGFVKPYAMFYSNKMTSDKLGSWCRACIALANKKNPNKTDHKKRYLESENYRKYQLRYHKEKYQRELKDKEELERYRKYFADRNITPPKQD